MPETANLAAGQKRGHGDVSKVQPLGYQAIENTGYFSETADGPVLAD